MSVAGLPQTNPKKQQLSRFLWTILDWLYPPHCVNCNQCGFVICDSCYSEIETLGEKVCKKCGMPVAHKKRLCISCQTKSTAYSAMRSWAVFSGVTRKALHSLKYDRNIALGRIFAKPLAEIVKSNQWKIDLVVPIPLSRSRLRKRGYNQAACISRDVAAMLNISHSPQALIRVKETETQISLDVNERFMNLMDAFNGIPATLKEQNVLLIDDVITTGATMQNCAIAAKNAGAKDVFCLSVARTLLKNP